jgi:dolichol-phosphate mannosyltransferase
MNNQIALVIPTFNESESMDDLFENLEQLKFEFPALHIIFVDDSPNALTSIAINTQLDQRSAIKDHCTVIQRNSKQGRGSAVRDGFLSVSNDESFLYFLECDADGSHDLQGIRDVITTLRENAFVIGSRYLPQSRIVGWPISRRLFSRMINLSLRFLFGLRTYDFTNGLRGYSRSSVLEILASNQMNAGFIYLTEQILILSKVGVNPIEIPITFIDRKKGESSVTYRELLDSALGVLSLRLKYR